MKKILSLIMIVAIALLVTGCEEKNPYYKELTFKQLQEKLDNGDTFMFAIVQNGCPHCSVFEPRFKAVLKEYEVEGFYINFTKLSEADYNDFVDTFGSLGTPTVIFITDGIENTTMNRMTGEVTKKEIIRKLKQNGYIEEDNNQEEE